MSLFLTLHHPLRLMPPIKNLRDDLRHDVCRARIRPTLRLLSNSKKKQHKLKLVSRFATVDELERQYTQSSPGGPLKPGTNNLLFTIYTRRKQMGSSSGTETRCQVARQRHESARMEVYISTRRWVQTSLGSMREGK
jgi:hypothetical protein